MRPRWVQSVRFRLSLDYSLLVFIIGCAMVGGLYLWQARQLDEPTVSGHQVLLLDPRTGEARPWVVFTRDEQQLRALQLFERAVNRAALDDLRRGSLVAVGGVAVASFGVGWLLSGMALRPVGRISAFARHISATDLSQRVAMRGPDDELKELADTFDGMLDRLQEAFEGQRRFVQEASHELRNPLSVMQANLELALEGPDDPAQLRRSVEVAHRATDRMGNLVDDLLTSARLEAPGAPRGPVDVASLVAEAVVDFEATAATRGLDLVPSVDGDLVVGGDVTALRRALANLVANAVRLAPAGSTVNVSARREGPWVLLSVADEGPGIPAEQQPHVFDRFWRAPQHGADSRGSGLGLTIVRQVTERHGGDVSVVSEVGRGSRFTIRLPAGSASSPLPSLSADSVASDVQAPER